MVIFSSSSSLLPSLLPSFTSFHESFFPSSSSPPSINSVLGAVVWFQDKWWNILPPRCSQIGNGKKKFNIVVSFPGGSAVKNLPAVQETQETWVWSLGQEDPLEEGITPHSSIFAWRMPRTEEPGGLQSTGLQRVGHDWSELASMRARIVVQNDKNYAEDSAQISRNINNSVLIHDSQLALRLGWGGKWGGLDLICSFYCLPWYKCFHLGRFQSSNLVLLHAELSRYLHALLFSSQELAQHVTGKGT